MKKYLFLIVLFHNFCYADEPPSWEPYKVVSENREYFCWVDFNDNDTSKYEWERKWILKVYNKDSTLFWERDYQPSGYSGGILSNDGRKFIYIEYWYSPNYAIEITKQDGNDIRIAGKDFNIKEHYLQETESHRLWLDYDLYYLKNNKLVVSTIDGNVWEIDTETGIMKMSVQNHFGLALTASFLLLVFVAFVAVVIIRNFKKY